MYRRCIKNYKASRGGYTISCKKNIRFLPRMRDPFRLMLTCDDTRYNLATPKKTCYTSRAPTVPLQQENECEPRCTDDLQTYCSPMER